MAEQDQPTPAPKYRRVVLKISGEGLCHEGGFGLETAELTALAQEVTHTPGRFLAAWGEEASQENEQTLIRFATPDGDVWVKLIAGLIARRIVCRVKPGQKVSAGERIGLIRFGSRVDCILPAAAVLRVRRGQMVKGGSTVLGVIP